MRALEIHSSKALVPASVGLVEMWSFANKRWESTVKTFWIKTLFSSKHRHHHGASFFSINICTRSGTGDNKKKIFCVVRRFDYFFPFATRFLQSVYLPRRCWHDIICSLMCALPIQWRNRFNKIRFDDALLSPHFPSRLWCGKWIRIVLVAQNKKK